MAPPREPHSRAIWSKNKPFHENAVTGIEWSCMLSLIGSCHHIFSINASLTFNISGIKRIVTSQEDATSITETFPLVIYTIDFFVEILLSNSFSGIGEARIFQRGGHIVSKWGYSFIWTFSSWNVIAFSLPVLGFLVKEGLQKGGGSRAPQDPLPTPLSGCIVV